MQILKSFPFHFLLVASFQILSLYAINLNTVEISAAVFILFLTILLTSLLFLVFWLITRDLQRSGIMTTFYCFLFFIYGRLFDIMGGVHVGGFIIGRNKYLLPLFALVTIAGTMWVFRSRWLRRFIDRVTDFLNIFGLGLVAIAILMAATGFVRTYNDNERNIKITDAGIITGEHDTPIQNITVINKPNVYFFIFDSYTSLKVLRKYYGWDDHDLVDGLRSRGFIVNENALSNYPFTGLSINSYLNMDYVHEEPGFKIANNQGVYLENHIRQNKVMKYFKSQGYDVVTTSAGNKGHGETKIKKNTLYDRLGSLFLSEFMACVFQVSVLRIIQPELFADSRRNAILSEMNGLIQADKPSKPTFLYLHIMCPHPPYIFRADGSKPKLYESAWGRVENRRQYIEQVRFIGTKIIEIVDRVRNSDPDAIIIVRADHGHGYIVGNHLLNREKPPLAFLEAQFGILSATYLPSGIFMPEQSSPVNLFRYLFNALFDAKLEILPDKEFFTSIKEPYLFYETTNDLTK